MIWELTARFGMARADFDLDFDCAGLFLSIVSRGVPNTLMTSVRILKTLVRKSMQYKINFNDNDLRKKFHVQLRFEFQLDLLPL